MTDLNIKNYLDKLQSDYRIGDICVKKPYLDFEYCIFCYDNEHGDFMEVEINLYPGLEFKFKCSKITLNVEDEYNIDIDEKIIHFHFNPQTGKLN